MAEAGHPASPTRGHPAVDLGTARAADSRDGKMNVTASECAGKTTGEVRPMTPQPSSLVRVRPKRASVIAPDQRSGLPVASKTAGIGPKGTII